MISSLLFCYKGAFVCQVCNSTKLQYVDLLAQWRLAVRCRAETDAFLRGLALLVPDNLLGKLGA